MKVLSKISMFVVLAAFSTPGRTAEGDAYKSEMVGLGGLQHFPGVTKASLGGQIGTTFAGNSVLFAETTYIPYGEGLKRLNWIGGLNVGIPTRIDKFVPYFSVFGGLSRLSGQGYESENDATFGAGFGARYYLGPRWGIRPEFRWQRYQQAAGGVNSYCFSAGLFYRFGAR